MKKLTNSTMTVSHTQTQIKWTNNILKLNNQIFTPKTLKF
jgi:hypothetical protein